MSSKASQDEPGLKAHIRVYLGFLGLPVLAPLGLLTPLVEQSRLFADGGWWKSLTLLEQVIFVTRNWAIWVAAVTTFALLLSLFSPRWRRKFWGPMASGIRRVISVLGLLLISRADFTRLVDQEIDARARMAAAAGPPKGSPCGVPGVMVYGDICTRSGLYDRDLMVEWISTGLPFGKLVPSPGNTWEVHYGHLERHGIYPEFVADEKLGRVKEPWEGVQQLRERDLQQGQVLKANIRGRR
ncbi:hypothetical protein ACIPWF_09730 [Paenarthrobacter sp. NPDC089989]|uniref:hypothetical protein n=1 Tax=unclassified Paenarthrobacter TaxID=2634190 RepID=UPI00382316FF